MSNIQDFITSSGPVKAAQSVSSEINYAHVNRKNIGQGPYFFVLIEQGTSTEQETID